MCDIYDNIVQVVKRMEYYAIVAFMNELLIASVCSEMRNTCVMLVYRVF